MFAANRGTLNSNGTTFGINGPTAADPASLLNSAAGPGTVSIAFDQTVRSERLSLSPFGDDDRAVLDFGGGDRRVLENGAGTNFAFGNAFIAAGQRISLGADPAESALGNGFSFDRFAVGFASPTGGDGRPAPRGRRAAPRPAGGRPARPDALRAGRAVGRRPPQPPRHAG